MIVVRFKGGLGNQIFQYAAARALADRTGRRLLWDRSWYSVPANQVAVGRCFDLGWFQVRHAEDAGVVDRRLFRMADHARFERFVAAGARLLGRRLLRDDGMGFRQPTASGSGRLLLEGYFQHPGYFSASADVLRAELVLRTEPPAKVREFAARLAATASVCIQVRRTDFVSNPEAARLHGCVSSDYYRAAWRKILEQEPCAKGYVFTDDQAWAREFFGDWPAEIVSPEWDGPAYLHRFHLMRHCRHFILVNSTWGWWAAWLGAKNGGRVIVPSRWLAGMDTSETGLLLPGWETVDAQGRARA